MKLCTFTRPHSNIPRLGVLTDESVIDVGALADALGAAMPLSVIDALREVPVGLRALGRWLRECPLTVRARYAFALASIRLLPPLVPGKILCSGINYHGHLRENPRAVLPSEPFFFAKLPSAVVGPEDRIRIPRRSRQVDYEVELAVVIGGRMRGTPAADAMSHVAGYTLLNDVSARDVQMKDNQITLGKNFDTFAPLGPWITTADELPDPGNIALRTRVNGAVLQDSSTADWVFPLPVLLAELTAVMTLEPGDIVTTGTPAGVGLFRDPPLFLKPGDVVEIEAAGIGTLRNPVSF